MTIKPSVLSGKLGHGRTSYPGGKASRKRELEQTKVGSRQFALTEVKVKVNCPLPTASSFPLKIRPLARLNKARPIIRMSPIHILQQLQLHLPQSLTTPFPRLQLLV